MKLTNHSMNYDVLKPLIARFQQKETIDSFETSVFVATLLWVRLSKNQQQQVVNDLVKTLERKGL